MNILVVNDDGYNAVGIKKLANHLKKYGKVVVCGPDTGRSASGHSIFLHKPISYIYQGQENGIEWYSISGMPADCVRLSVDLLPITFDLVFSGINNGLNLGTDIIYSGTVSAAREANIEGIPAVAISTDFDSFEIVDAELEGLLQYIIEQELYSTSYVLNVNFPTSKFASSVGYRFCQQGLKSFKSSFRKIAENTYMESGSVITYDEREDTDVYLSNQGYITFVPLQVEQTSIVALEELKKRIK
ncbi:MAG: 5'/3'-nucleotidase SurE [Anaeroplasmataceae bacterium]|nr:5'/3'-nucleotidase SurE [Anaeroplasmataceae bacterium]